MRLRHKATQQSNGGQVLRASSTTHSEPPSYSSSEDDDNKPRSRACWLKQTPVVIKAKEFSTVSRKSVRNHFEKAGKYVHSGKGFKVALRSRRQL